MADSYTDLGLTKPEPGASLNTWGSKLNVVINMINAMQKFATVTITGDTSVVFTNADAAATALPFGLKLRPSGLAAAFTLTVPAVGKPWVVWNNAGYTATVKPSGGTGVSVPDGCIVLLEYTAHDGDVENVSPNHIGTARTPVNSGDIANVAFVASAIAASVPAGTAGTLFNSVTDTTRDYLATKLTFSGSLVATTSNPGANETRDVAFTFDEGQNFIANQVFS